MIRIAAWATALLIGFGLPPSAFAQTPAAAVLTGVVYDSAGDPLEGARVVARDVETGFVYSAASSGTGRYWLPGLPPARYEVKVVRLGFEPMIPRAALLSVGRTVTLDLVLRPEAVELTPIEVRAEAPQAATSESGVAFVFDRGKLATLPEESRRFTDLARLAPGATAAPETGEQIASVGVGGLGAYSTGILVDGGNFMGHAINELTGSIPLLAVQEFGVVISTYAAEYGQAASGLVNVATRRGTNRLSAEAFGLYRDRALNATGPFESAKPDYKRTHWGMAAGGPITRDRTHFFVAGERRVENAFVTIDTRGLFPAQEGTFKTPFTDNLLFGRLDHRIGDAHQLTFRYVGELLDQLTDVGESRFCAAVGGGGPGAYEQGVTRDRRTHSALLLDRWTIGPETFNEARLHVIGYAEDREPIGTGGTLVYPSLCAGSNLIDARLRNLRVELRDDFSTIVAGRTGTHRLKLGILASWLRPTMRVGIIPRGAFVFPSDTSSAPAFALIGLGTNRLEVRNLQLGAYVQDDWNPVANLTLNVGLRYDIETNGTNQDFVSAVAGSLPFVRASPRPLDGNNIAPRLGFAWSPGGKGRTVLRGGFGIFYDQALSYLIAWERSNPNLVFVPSPGTTDASQVPLDPDEVPEGPTVLGREMRTPFTRQFSLGIESVGPAGLMLRVDGLLVRGRNLPISRQLNTLDSTGSFRYPQFSSVSQTLNRGEALAKLLLVRVGKTFPGGWLDLSYTLGSRKTTSDIWFERSPQVDPANEDFSGDLGPAAWDERHRLVGLGGATLPLGFEVTLKTVYSSGRPYTAVTGTDDNGDSFLNDRLPRERRNARRGPDFVVVDLGVMRPIQVGSATVQLRVNVYNLFNRTNLSPASVVGNLQSPFFGKALGALPKRQVEVGLEAQY
jgi:outer membrane receptor protein involved in Fe transport